LYYDAEMGTVTRYTLRRNAASTIKGFFLRSIQETSHARPNAHEYYKVIARNHVLKQDIGDSI